MSDSHATLQSAPKLWQNLAFALLVPILLLLVALWLGAQNAKLIVAGEAVQASYSRQLAMESMFSTMKDAETGQRGYVITGKASFLEPFNRARAVLPVQLAQLDRMAADRTDVDITPEMRRIAQLIDRKFAEMLRIKEIRDSQGLNAASRGVANGLGKVLMDDIRRQMAQIDRKEKDAFERRQAQARAQLAWVKTTYIAGVILLALGGVAIAYILWHGRTTRYNALKRMIDASTRHVAIFQNSLDAIILINPSGSMEILNPAAERLFGYSATGLLRRDISIIIDIAPGEGPFLDRLGLGPDGTLVEAFRPMVMAHRQDGTMVAVEIALGVMPLDDGTHIVAVLRDISEREKVERMKDQFLSTVSHELRTPLTSIVGSLGLLRGGAVDQLSPAAQRLVVIAENNANRLIRIVNDILDAEKLQSGAMTFDFHPLDLRGVMENAADAMRGLADTRHIRLAVSSGASPVMVRGDGDRLLQVLTNLLSNAIKFSPVGSQIRVEIDHDGQLAEISVIDAGAGIAADVRDRLFTRFAQSAKVTSTTPGTGLGLTITREIVHNHGGRIWHEDAPGGGSIFRISLPMWNALTGQEDLNGAPRLLVFAEEGEAQSISRGFAARAIRADVVTAAPAALHAATARNYLALILDFAFAGDDAIALLQAIRADPRSRPLPVIAIAAETPAAAAGDIGSLDIIDWIIKPIAPMRLDEAIGAAVDRAAVAMPLVLHIDDDSDTLEITARALSGVARMAQAPDLKTARAFLAEHDVDIAIVDLALPDGSGLDIVEDLGRDGRGTPIIIYSAQDGDGDVARNVEAMLTKSRRSLPNLVDTVMGILERRKQEEVA